MTPRSKRYHDNKHSENGSKKGSANKEGYNEQNQLNIKKPNENKAPTRSEEETQQRKSKKNSE